MKLECAELSEKGENGINVDWERGKRKKEEGGKGSGGNTSSGEVSNSREGITTNGNIIVGIFK